MVSFDLSFSLLPRPRTLIIPQNTVLITGVPYTQTHTRCDHFVAHQQTYRINSRRSRRAQIYVCYRIMVHFQSMHTTQNNPRNIHTSTKQSTLCTFLPAELLDYGQKKTSSSVCTLFYSLSFFRVVFIYSGLLMHVVRIINWIN